MMTMNSISAIFHENTKIFFWEKSMTPQEFWGEIHFKTYPRFEKIILPKNLKTSSLLEKVIKKRRSIREFSGKPISLKQISKILFYSAGITYKNKNWNETRRAYPSAGARYPLELYPIILNGTDIKRGIYHYNVKLHCLEIIKRGDFKNKLLEITNQEWVKNANMFIPISAIFKRTQMKYGERGYRYIFLDAGHLAQNIYLITTAIGLGCCTIGGFLDNEINKLLELDGKTESVIYIAVIGTIY
jgi:SagB-type dehydrogenase family enzyme